MMSGNVCDGWKLVRRSYYGRHSRIRSLERSLRGVEMQRKTVTYTRYRPTARVLSTILIASVVVVVIVIENRAENDASGR